MQPPPYRHLDTLEEKILEEGVNAAGKRFIRFEFSNGHHGKRTYDPVKKGWRFDFPDGGYEYVNDDGSGYLKTHDGHVRYQNTSNCVRYTIQVPGGQPKTIHCIDECDKQKDEYGHDVHFCGVDRELAIRLDHPQTVPQPRPQRFADQWAALVRATPGMDEGQRLHRMACDFQRERASAGGYDPNMYMNDDGTYYDIGPIMRLGTEEGYYDDYEGMYPEDDSGYYGEPYDSDDRSSRSLSPSSSPPGQMDNDVASCDGSNAKGEQASLNREEAVEELSMVKKQAGPLTRSRTQNGKRKSGDLEQPQEVDGPSKRRA